MKTNNPDSNRSDWYHGLREVVEDLEQLLGTMQMYPISMCVPEELVVEGVPEKVQIFGGGMKSQDGPYRFGPGQEREYHEDYQRSFFGLSHRKGGWECLRHLEILLNGCALFMPDLENCPKWTMANYPKALIAKVLSRYPQLRREDSRTLNELDLSLERDEQYIRLIEANLDHVRKHLTSRAVSNYLLNVMGLPDAKKVLFVSSGKKPDYVCDLLLVGLRFLLGEGLVDIRKPPWLYDDWDRGKSRRIYGHGFTYAGHLPSLPVDRRKIRRRIIDREFDLIVYGSVQRCAPGLSFVRRHYPRECVALIDGEDSSSLEVSFPCRWAGFHPLSRPWEGKPFVAGDKMASLFNQGVLFKREIDERTIQQAKSLVHGISSNHLG